MPPVAVDCISCSWMHACGLHKERGHEKKGGMQSIPPLAWKVKDFFVNSDLDLVLGIHMPPVDVDCISCR